MIVKPRIILNFSTNDHLTARYGLYRYCVDLIDGLAQLDNAANFVVLGSRHHPVPELEWIFRKHADRWNYVNIKRRRCRGGYFIDQVPVARLIAKLKGNLFHGLDYFLPFFSNIPLVATVFDLYAEHGKNQTNRNCSYIECFKILSKFRIARLIAASNATAKDIKDFWKISTKKITTIPLGTRILRRKSKCTRDPNIILTRYCLLPNKNLFNLVRAMGIVKNSCPNAKLVLYGHANISSQAEEEFDSLVLNCGISSMVEKLGFVSDEKLEELYDTAGMFVLPSLSEGFGLPLVEAMSRGLPVVCHQEGAMAEVVGEAGILIDVRNPANLAAGIIRVIYNPVERSKLELAGYNRSEYYSAKRMANETFDVYMQILTQKM